MDKDVKIGLAVGLLLVVAVVLWFAVGGDEDTPTTVADSGDKGGKSASTPIPGYGSSSAGGSATPQLLRPRRRQPPFRRP